jgi:DNA invertase Pin-like site-specific DNA recombinase
MRRGYARVSTKKQDTQSQTNQLNDAKCEVIYTEQASGSRDDRPELRRCLAELEPGDTLVVWKLDRLGRSLPHLLTTVNGLSERGIGFECLTQPVNTTDATGRLVLSILGALAEFERALIRERVQAGVDAAKLRGAKLGRPALADERLQAAREMLASGKNLSATARALGVGRATLYRHRDVLGID